MTTPAQINVVATMKITANIKASLFIAVFLSEAETSYSAWSWVGYESGQGFPALIPWCATIASNTSLQLMTAPSISPESAVKPARLSRARRNAILKALADPKRFELLERIAKSSCPLGCSVVRPALAISPATLSHHIRELEAAGLIDVARQGKFHFLSLRPGVLEALVANLGSLSAQRCGNGEREPR